MLLGVVVVGLGLEFCEIGRVGLPLGLQCANLDNQLFVGTLEGEVAHLSRGVPSYSAFREGECPVLRPAVGGNGSSADGGGEAECGDQACNQHDGGVEKCGKKSFKSSYCAAHCGDL